MGVSACSPDNCLIGNPHNWLHNCREFHTTIVEPIMWSRQLSGATLDLSHSDLVHYRCYKRKPVGAHPLQTCVLLLRQAYTWYMVCVCVYVCMCMYQIFSNALTPSFYWERRASVGASAYSLSRGPYTVY